MMMTRSPTVTFVGGRPVELNRAAASLARDRVGREALAVVDVDEANKIISAGDHAGTVPEDSPRARELGLKSSGV